MTTALLTSYTHDQSAASSTWTINHNLGSVPVVEISLIENGQMKKAFPLSLTHPSVNQTVVTWSSPRTGKAFLISGTYSVLCLALLMEKEEQCCRKWKM